MCRSGLQELRLPVRGGGIDCWVLFNHISLYFISRFVKMQFVQRMT